MPIQADVGQLERLARKVRNHSQTVARETRKINDSIAAIVWKGKAHDRFQTEFRPTQQKMTQAARDLDEFAARLERIAEAFRQADMAEDRRREAEARARREQERAAREASRSKK
jgi:WXG100 family type VII secretion target